MANLSDSPTPCISVLMSCYNAEEWLGASIESVLKQTHTDFEFIIVNDGSQDGTLALARDHAARDARIVVIDKPNTALADSLNKGIERVRGEWIARLDADDLCEPERLARQLAAVRARPGLVLLGSGFTEIDETGGVIRTHRYPDSHNALVRRLERSGAFFPHSSVFMRTTAVRQVGGYRPQFKRSQDTDMWLRLSEVGQIGCLQEPLVRIRVHAQQITHTGGGKMSWLYSLAARTSYFLRRAGAADPAGAESEAERGAYFSWIEVKMDRHRVLERRQAWQRARAGYFERRGGIQGGATFLSRLLASGYALPLLWEKAFGTALCRRLAKEWISEKVRARASGAPLEVNT